MSKSNLSWRSFLGSALVLGGLVLVLAMLTTSPTGTWAGEQKGFNQGKDTQVIDRDSVAYGRTYSELSAAWWQWAFSIPVASHPLFDNGDCSVGQAGSVWFLGGKFVPVGGPPASGASANRSCLVPADKALYFPILNGEDSAPEEIAGAGCGNLPPLIQGTIAELRQCAAPGFDGAIDLSATIDGHSIQNLQTNFRVQSSVFGFTLPDDNLLKATGVNIPAGTYYPSAGDGFYVMLAPLSPGHHVLYTHGAFSNGFYEDITYHLYVTK